MWEYKGKSVKGHNDLLPECTDIVYLIMYSTGDLYIGKKTVRSVSTLPALKKPRKNAIRRFNRDILRDADGKVITSKAGRAKARRLGIKATREVYEDVLTDKPFMKYKGSSEIAKELTPIKKEIVFQCSNKMTATYLEASLMFKMDAITDPKFLNKNILGKFFDNALDGLL